MQKTSLAKFDVYSEFYVEDQIHFIRKKTKPIGMCFDTTKVNSKTIGSERSERASGYITYLPMAGWRCERSERARQSQILNILFYRYRLIAAFTQMLSFCCKFLVTCCISRQVPMNE